jgi:methionyl-tRNA formyltransferase
VGIKLAFMGSSTFALPSLNRLFERGYEITAVITQPDKPSGRGQTLQGPPVKRRALELSLPLHQPKSLKTGDAHELFNTLAPDMIVVVAYGKLLPPWLLELPRYGCINLHGSILPKYRGAAPVHWAIANGEEKTGVCSMLLEEGLDTGPVYLCEETHIGSEETAPQLYDRLAEIGGPLMLATVEGIVSGTLKPKPQDDSQATFAPILKKQHGFIDWTLPAAEIHNCVRAFNPWPGTTTVFRGVVCKILKTTVAAVDDRRGSGGLEIVGGHRPPLQSDPGTIVLTKRSMEVVCRDGALLDILLIQPENRKAVSGADFANGARIQPDEKFQSVMDN